MRGRRAIATPMLWPRVPGWVGVIVAEVPGRAGNDQPAATRAEDYSPSDVFRPASTKALVLASVPRAHVAASCSLFSRW
jgi:hypothetical protein